MMAKKYTFKTDTLVSILFTKYHDLLIRLIAEIVGVKPENVDKSEIDITGIAPEELGKKFCRLYIDLKTKGEKVDLYIQVADCELIKHPHHQGNCEGVREEREKWQGIVADKDARIAELEALLKSCSAD